VVKQIENDVGGREGSRQRPNLERIWTINLHHHDQADNDIWAIADIVSSSGSNESNSGQKNWW
jgi:hypothetical protein